MNCCYLFSQLRKLRLRMRHCARIVAASLLGASLEAQAQLITDGGVEDPCWVQDEKSVAPALIYSVVMIDDPSSDPEEVQAIFGRALVAECKVDETDETGATALIYSIIFNRPQMAEQLLQAGANAYVRLRHNRPVLNGKNAFEVLDLFLDRQPLTDRSQLRDVLERQHERRVSKIH